MTQRQTFKKPNSKNRHVNVISMTQSVEILMHLSGLDTVSASGVSGMIETISRIGVPVDGISRLPHCPFTAVTSPLHDQTPT